MEPGEFRSWFAEDELEPCPGCSGRSALRNVDARVVLCLECGVVPLAPGDARRTSADE